MFRSYTVVVVFGLFPQRSAITLVYASTVFVSAFLIFQVQPIIASYILPWYGGSSAVWITCLLFFQAMLLVGYAYSHVLANLLSIRKQVILHLILLALSLLLLPITPSDALKPTGGASPIAGILTLLLVTVGVPYLFVTASAPLMQHWFSHSYPQRSPYRLYALANLGSLLGLITYPFLFEPHLTVEGQTLFWSGGYLLYVILAGVCGILVARFGSSIAGDASHPTDSEDAETVSSGRRLLWVVLPCCASVILLAGTNQITQNIAVVPFLWILPLSLYLITFIIAFDHEKWYNRFVYIPLLAIGLGVATWALRTNGIAQAFDIRASIAAFSLSIFLCCMVCHGELVRLKPHPSRLTEFYFMVSLGGALGGVFVNLIAPHIFTGFWELHISYVGTFFLAGLCISLNPGPLPAVLGPSTELGQILRKHSTTIRVVFTTIWLAAIGILGAQLFSHIQHSRASTIAATRSFYGVLSIEEYGIGTRYHRYHLIHGTIDHGGQYLAPDKRDRPITYYPQYSGAAVAFNYHPARKKSATGNLKIGVLGLGTGTLAAYGRPGDKIRFYEIDKEVVKFARNYFTYLQDSPADTEIILGDGRISLERELENNGPQGFDILVLDAFSSDAVPIHLLTKEAFRLYWKHLKSDGILVVNISNNYVDLSDVVRVLAHKFGKQAVLFDHGGNSDRNIYTARWVLVTSNEKFLKTRKAYTAYTPWDRPEPRQILWTDDFSNLFEVLK